MQTNQVRWEASTKKKKKKKKTPQNQQRMAVGSIRQVLLESKQRGKGLQPRGHGLRKKVRGLKANT